MATTPNIDDPIIPQGVTLREFDDTQAARKAIYDGTLEALKKRFPLENKSYRLELSNVRYTGPQEFTLAQQKHALLNDRNLHTPVTGHFKLFRKSDGALVDEKDEVVMNVPYYTDRGTIINNGSEYTVANQLRLRPGVYTRVRRSGDVETQFNVRPGTGRGFRLRMEPSTGVVTVNVGHANMPLYPLLRALGVTDKQMIKAWGADVAYANAQKADSVSGRSAIDKLYQAFAGYNADAQDLVSKEEYLKETLPKFALDPGVTSRTLGMAAEGVTPEVLLRASQKMFNVNRGEEEVDDRDNPGFANVYGIEDLYRERIEKDAGKLSRQIMMKISRSGSLKPVGRGAFSGWHNELLQGSGLAMPGDNSNPMALEEQMLRVTRLGEGGISSPDLLTDEARQMNPGNLNFIDMMAGPENCMPGDAEVMTAAGWVRWDSVTPDTIFACMVDGRLEYHKAEALHVYDFDGTLYCGKSHALAYKYTPNHRMWCAPRSDRPRFRFEFAKDVHCTKGRVIMTGGHQPFVGTYREFFQLPPVVNPGNAYKPIPAIPMRDWAAFMGWYLTEGSTCYVPNKMFSVHIAQQKTGCLSVLSKVIAAMPFKMYAVYKTVRGKRIQYGYSGSSRQLCEYLHTFGLSYDKYIPDYLLNADMETRKALFAAILLGDGRRKRDTFTFCSASRRFADTFMQLAFGLGYTAHLRFERDDRPVSNTGGMWCVHVLKGGYHQIVNDKYRSQMYTEHYAGKVYCATVPGGLMYCRYGDGLGYWTGNSRIGADARLGVYTRKGSDGRLYSLFVNRQGRKEYVAADTASDSVIGFPAADPKAAEVPAMKHGKVQMVPREEVDYFVPAMAGMFSSSINLNPMPTSVQGGRQFYAAKFWAQYMPTVHGESPLVDSLMPDGKLTWREYYGRKLGTLKSPADGRVTKVTDGGVTVVDKNGKKHFVETVTDFPFNGLTGLTYKPTVKVGDEVKSGDMVAASNFVDPKTGSLAMGHNMHVAWIPYKGQSHEDAIVMSESAAKKLATDRLYGFESDPRDGGELGLNKYMSSFPKRFTKEQYSTLDDNGVVKEGTVLHRGDPISVAVGPKMLTAEDANLGKLSKVLRGAFTDKAQTWEHDYPGTVVSSTVFRGRAKVNVKAAPPLQVGDKACYDEETEVLTASGWKHFRDVTVRDNVATLDPDTGVFDYLRPELVHAYRHSGKMYRLRNSCLDILVTDNHRLFVRRRGSSRFEFVEARDAVGARLSYKKDGTWVGRELSTFTFPAYTIGHRWGLVTKPETTIGMDAFLAVLGMFLSEGSCYSPRRAGSLCGAGISIAQKKPDNVEACRAALDAYGIRYSYRKDHGFRLAGRHWYNYFSQFGYAWEKYIPDFVFGLSARQQRILFSWMMWGDGHYRHGMPKTYTTTSRRLADDLQRLCLHIGIAARISPKQPAGHANGKIGDRPIVTKHDSYTVQIINRKLTPTVNHGHVETQHVQEEGFVDYDGYVYCCTMPKWHAIYVRRNGHAYWCGNSPGFALKGVCGMVIPDDKMPRDAATNEPYDILMNPMGIPSRIAPGQLIETALGKLAKATGKQIRIPQDPPPEGWAAWAKAQLDAAGVKSTADIFDPETGKTIRGIGDGYVYWHAMHHIADKKLSAKGGTGGYTADLQPAKGGPHGAKRNSGLDNWALLAHGATEVMKDIQTIRGTKNENYWKAVRAGGPLPAPEVPFIYQKAMNLLRAGGINVVEGQKATDILPMTDKATDELTGGRVITNAKMLDNDMKEIPGGLFDPFMTGGSGNRSRWASIRLPEPIPNPVMEEPVRRVLGLTTKRLQAVISGDEQLNGKTGGAALLDALKEVDVEKEIARQREIVRKSRGSARDNAVKVLGYLDGCRKQGLEPKDWMITKIPVIPPMFRPIARLGDTSLVSDINELYRDVIESSDSFRQLKKDVPDSGLTEERLNIYKAVKAAYGLGDPISPEGQAKRLKGAIRQVIGAGSPKAGLWQAKVMSKAVDGVGRSVISPETSYDMDQCGIPEDAAWTLYKDYVTRAMVRRGYSQDQAVRLIGERAPVAKSLLLEEMGRRPVILDRAPTWHKFNYMAFWPSLVSGSTMRMNPLVLKGFTADFDGDQMNFHVPASDKAVSEAIEKMMPSKNLISTTDLRTPRHVPSMEMTLGLAKLTAPASKAKPKVFITASDAIRAYRRGEIGANDPVSILRR